ncbi:hypothetical protein RJ639_021272 [Escallonia herrerae]|uniref:Uncharacterized protein n=1 Tax=Escallonia herrerae TaxID=1293975 RepID=A0AA89AG96_9ASTE|nr:hypothetical protein RJ639_021272 [Escallonia herrerae]
MFIVSKPSKMSLLVQGRRKGALYLQISAPQNGRNADFGFVCPVPCIYRENRFGPSAPAGPTVCEVCSNAGWLLRPDLVSGKAAFARSLIERVVEQAFSDASLILKSTRAIVLSSRVLLRPHTGE